MVWPHRSLRLQWVQESREMDKKSYFSRVREVVKGKEGVHFWFHIIRSLLITTTGNRSGFNTNLAESNFYPCSGYSPCRWVVPYLVQSWVKGFYVLQWHWNTNKSRIDETLLFEEVKGLNTRLTDKKDIESRCYDKILVWRPISHFTVVNNRRPL